MSFSFGAPAPSTFGAAPAPNTFGAAPAPSTFGAAPAPITFGAPAPSAFGASATGGFGSPAQAPFSFASNAPAPALSPFGNTTQGAPPAAAISGKTPYSQLPQHYRNAIDQIHENMMKHKRTIIQLQSSGPSALQKDPASADPEKTTLSTRLARIKKTLHDLHQDVGASLDRALEQKERIEELTKEAYMFAKWPTEAIGARRGVVLSQPQLPVVAGEEKKQETAVDTQGRFREVLAAASASVDRLERMPSPYLWLLLKDFERRLVHVHEDLHSLRLQLQQNQRMMQSESGLPIASLVEEQHRKLAAVGDEISRLSFMVQKVRQSYNHYEKEENVLDKEKWEEMERERKLNDQIQRRFLESASSTAVGSTASGLTASAPASTGGGPSGVGGFGGTSLFGSAPTAAPTGAPTFGSTPTASFGSTGSTFGSTKASAPSAFGGFASSSSSNPPVAPKKKSNTRSGGRLHAAGR